MNALVVVNPNAAGGRAGRTFPAVRAVLERRTGSLEVATTHAPGHAIDLAREATARGVQLVVAVGGDGTLHEVANGVLDAGGGAAVGYIGLGTGGDFRRTLGIAHRLEAYVDAIAGENEVRIDVGRARFSGADGIVRSRWFVNILSAGLGGLVDQRVATTTKAFGNAAAYYLASLTALAACRRGRVRARTTLAGRQLDMGLTAYMIAICNGRYFGGGMHVAPMARVDDGRLEVVSMDAEGKVAFVGFSRRIYAGTHLSAPGVEHFGCDRISLELEDERLRDVFLLDVDGEALGRMPIDVELHPRALRVRVPRG